MRSDSIMRLSFAVMAMTVALLGWANRAAGQCLVEERQKLTAADAAPGNSLGHSVSVSGDVVVIGAPGDDVSGGRKDVGSAYVFRFDGTTWVQEQKLLASDGAGSDYFGYAVSVSGNVAVIGASGDNLPGSRDAGSAYVFRFDGSTWVQEQKLTGFGGSSLFEYFGSSVSVSGDVVVIGAPGALHSGSFEGSAYVFRYDGTSWVPQQELTATDGGQFDYFGNSVSISSNIIVVGAFGNPGGSDKGAAYVFAYTGTKWVQDQKLRASDTAALDQFGDSVAVSGGVTMIGAPRADHAGGVDAGSVYVFRDNGSDWVEEQKLTASDAASADNFGDSVAVNGDVAVIGASADDHAAGTDAGSAYVFRYDGTTWVQEQQLIAAGAASFDAFGSSVAATADLTVIGAYRGDQTGASDAGAAYVFAPPKATWLNYGSGWPGTSGVPSFTSSGDPILCTTIALNLANSLGASTTAALVIGLSPADIPTVFDGHLLVAPIATVLLVLPAGGLALAAPLPCDASLCGIAVYLQALEQDSGASQGIAFTAGLELSFGS